MQEESQQNIQEQGNAANSCAASCGNVPKDSFSKNGNAKVWIEKISEDGRYGIFGEMDIETVKSTRNLIYPLLDSTDVLELDFSGVKRVDSVGLGLLIEWVRESKKRKKEVKYFNIPEQLCAIARVSSLELVLPLFRS